MLSCVKSVWSNWFFSALYFVENISALNTGSTTSAHYLVLTDVEGNRSYATCLRFYKRYIMSRVCHGGTMLKIWNINLMREQFKFSAEYNCEFNTLCVELLKGENEYIPVWETKFLEYSPENRCSLYILIQNSSCPGQFSTSPDQNALTLASGRVLVSLTLVLFHFKCWHSSRLHWYSRSSASKKTQTW